MTINGLGEPRKTEPIYPPGIKANFGVARLEEAGKNRLILLDYGGGGVICKTGPGRLFRDQPCEST
jgi:hypothetical protein